ncbi:MAG: NHLP leader peptide family RiPP precursor [Eubacteriales bacterium]
MADGIQKLVGQVRAKAWVDKGFRKALLENPKKAIEELFDITLQEQFKINVVEEKPDSITIVLPAQLNESELTDDELETVAGGGWGCFCDCFSADCFDTTCFG